MPEDDSPKVSGLAIAAESEEKSTGTAEASNVATEDSGTNGTKTAEEKDVVTDDAPTDAIVSATTNDKQVPLEEAADEKPATNSENTEVEAEPSAQDASPAGEDVTKEGANTPTAASKSKSAGRRKSGVPEHKSKKLSRKQSKAKLTQIDAKPGDYFYIRFRKFPLWPGIVADESMLPAAMLSKRPVSAADSEGEYRPDYANGGSRVHDRSFPVMFFATNEFAWIPNYDLLDLDRETVGNPVKGSKDLQEAHRVAAEGHELEHFHDLLRTHQAQIDADNQRQAEEAEEAKAAKAEKAEKAASKPKKAKSQKVVVEDDEDVEMTNADIEDAATSATSNKRKAEEDGIAIEPSKKLKLNLKLSSTPKASNGTSTPKPAKETPSAKSAKPKAKKATPKVAATPEAVIPKEPELTAEEKRAKKEKEILFLRHKLQKGLLTRDQPPKEDEMKQMSEFVSKLEGYSELEVSIIRATKINKVLKAILKLSSIPKEDEFNFKPRSQTLLDKWNKLLATESSTPATNGASETKTETDEAKHSPVDSTNGAKETATKIEEEKSVLKSPTPEKDEPAESASDPLLEKPSEASVPATAA